MWKYYIKESKEKVVYGTGKYLKIFWEEPYKRKLHVWFCEEGEDTSNSHYDILE